MNAPNLGHLITDAEHRRDAVHIAVAPVRAAGTLDPGQPVGFVAEGDIETVGAVEEAVGIVDPFLREPVQEGERFWLCLYPNTITGLRHVWTHPAFQAQYHAAMNQGAKS